MASPDPGVVATGIGQRGGLVGSVGGWQLQKPFLIGPGQGAGGLRCFWRRSPIRRRLAGAYVMDKKIVQPDPFALDDDLAERLWHESARLVGL